MIGEFLFIGLIAGLFGLFFRNCLKGENMIFEPYYLFLKNFVDQAEFCREFRTVAEEEGMNIKLYLFLGWLAYPLGYCIYCTTTWISIFLYILYISSWEVLPSWHWVVIGLITAMSISHLVVLSSCKWLLHEHPDF